MGRVAPGDRRARADDQRARGRKRGGAQHPASADARRRRSTRVRRGARPARAERAAPSATLRPRPDAHPVGTVAHAVATDARADPRLLWREPRLLWREPSLLWREPLERKTGPAALLREREHRRQHSRAERRRCRRDRVEPGAAGRRRACERARQIARERSAGSTRVSRTRPAGDRATPTPRERERSPIRPRRAGAAEQPSAAATSLAAVVATVASSSDDRAPHARSWVGAAGGARELEAAPAPPRGRIAAPAEEGASAGRGRKEGNRPKSSAAPCSSPTLRARRTRRTRSRS